MASFKKSTLRLLVDNKTNKVLFAEAGKDFLDFIFRILSLTLRDTAVMVSAGVIQTLGNISRLYKSVDDMGADYFLPSADKRNLLDTKVLGQGADDGRELLTRFKMYTCPGLCVTVTVDAKTECPRCKQAMATEMAYVLPSSSAAAQKGGDVGTEGASASDENGGYVKGLVTYMVTDGLEVTPITSSITLISRFSADKNVELAEKVVAVGMDEVRCSWIAGLIPATNQSFLLLILIFRLLRLLLCFLLGSLAGVDLQRLALIQAALRSDTVLSDVFLARKK